MEERSANSKSPTYDGKSLREEGGKWLERIAKAEKREDKWAKDALAAEKAYACDVDATEGKIYDFNILHSNVETMVPATYNSTPVPDIRRRYTLTDELNANPQDPMAQMQLQQDEQSDKDAKDFGLMVERAIAHQIDDNRLDREIEACARDAYLSGRGIIRVKFEADVDEENVNNERIEFEAVSWRDFRMGPGTRWHNVPWIAFRHRVPRETAELKHMDEELYGSQLADGDNALQTAEKDKDDIEFWEIWCEYDKKVKYVEASNNKIMKIMDDPMGLPGFWPIPEPIQPLELTGKTTPVCPFTIYRKLADELDTTTRRINAITKGLKVKGLVVGDMADLSALADAEDNTLVPIKGLEGAAAFGGLDKAISWWPVEQAAKVLQQLYEQREMTKQSIYEVTGISDIIRGQGNAGETATAQQIKTQWGALRIQRLQRLLERQCRDIFCMMADIIVRMFSPETLQEMTGIKITPGIKEMIDQGKVSRSYRIDVESDSTVRADLTRQKQDMTEFLAGTAQFIAAMGPALEIMPELGEPMATIYASFARVFKLGKQAEDALESLPKLIKQRQQQPQQPDPETMKAQADIQMQQAELALKQQQADVDAKIKENELQLKVAEGQAKIELEREKLELEKQKMALEMMAMHMEQQRAERESAMQQQQGQQEMGIKQDEMLMKADHEERRMDMEEQQASDQGRREDKKMDIESDHRNKDRQAKESKAA